MVWSMQEADTEIKGKTTENKKNPSIFSNTGLFKNTTKASRLLEIMSLVELQKQH